MRASLLQGCTRGSATRMLLSWLGTRRAEPFFADRAFQCRGNGWDPNALDVSDANLPKGAEPEHGTNSLKLRSSHQARGRPCIYPPCTQSQDFRSRCGLWWSFASPVLNSLVSLPEGGGNRCCRRFPDCARRVSARSRAGTRWP